MAADLKPEQKLTDDEVLAQITTFVRRFPLPFTAIVAARDKLITADVGRTRDDIYGHHIRAVPPSAPPGDPGKVAGRVARGHG